MSCIHVIPHVMYPCCVAIRSLALPGEYGTWYFDLDVVDMHRYQNFVWRYVDRRRSPGLGVFSGEGGSKRITTYPAKQCLGAGS